MKTNIKPELKQYSKKKNVLCLRVKYFMCRQCHKFKKVPHIRTFCLHIQQLHNIALHQKNKLQQIGYISNI